MLVLKIGVVLLLATLTALFYTDTKLLYSQSIHTEEGEACNQTTDSDADCEGEKQIRGLDLHCVNFEIRVAYFACECQHHVDVRGVPKN